MEVFKPMLNQMAVLFIFMIAGYILCKLRLLPENTGIVLSKLETFILIPALNINTFMTRFTIENLTSRWQSIVCSLILLTVAIGIGYFLSRRFSPKGYTRRIYLYSFVVANMGFMGNAIMQGVFGDDMLFDYLIFTLPMVMFVHTIGVSWLMPGISGKTSLKAVCSPMFISLLIGALLGLLNIKMPTFAANVLSSAAACMSPVAMILTGFIIGGFELKSLLNEKKIYIAAFFRLIIIPLVLTIAVKLLRLPEIIIICVLAAYCMPMGLNTIIIPSSYGGDTKLGAGIALISHVIAIITIPLMFALLI